jgi:hypothetical protein
VDLRSTHKAGNRQPKPDVLNDPRASAQFLSYGLIGVPAESGDFPIAPGATGRVRLPFPLGPFVFHKLGHEFLETLRLGAACGLCQGYLEVWMGRLGETNGR